MKTLLIIRHAKSSREDENLKDIDRPLAERGFSDAALMGKFLQSKSIHPDRLITSPALRARTTSQIIGEILAVSADKWQEEEEFYFGDVTEMIKLLQALKKEDDTVLLFGHNPAFSILANLLCPDFDHELPTTGIAGIQFITADWRLVKPGEGHLLWFEYPKKYR